MQTAWDQTYLVWGLPLFGSALVAAIPILLLLFLLGVKRKPAWLAALVGLAATILLAIAAYRLSFVHTLSSAAYGAAFGLFPITWIIYWAIVLYRITVETGNFEIIKQSVGRITSDMRLQVLLIAFAFGAFLEGGAGFGTPVAVASAMMTGLGFSALDASAICLLANTAPVAFGAIGIPVITLAGITGLPLDRLSADVGRVCAPVSFLVPAYLIAAAAGRRAVVEIWPAVLVCGATFASVQFFVSNFVGAPLTDILSSLLALAALIVLLRFWRPRGDVESEQRSTRVSLRALRNAADVTHSSPLPSASNTATMLQHERAPQLRTREVIVAWMPYILLVLFVLAWGYKPVQQFLNGATAAFHWPWLHNEIRRMPPVVVKPSAYAATFTLNWLSAAGTSCMFAALVSAAFLRMKAHAIIRLLASVARQLFLPTLTVTAVLAMAFVMNYCGATGTLGLAFAATGALFPFFSSMLGWLGVFLTGSDTSANALFGNLQVVTAQKLGFAPTLMAAANSAGGVMGKMISLQTIAVAAAATGLTVPEQATLFRFTLRHSIFLAAVIGIEVFVYAYVFHVQ
ncbi:MAG: lactate permease LctP family transporter [Acidobacteriaceae bacterium]|nr:lactate permease LctP family transporter [Acidobacteriaceae bacterium]